VQGYFGETIDAKLNLFKVNTFYVLHASFGKGDGLEKLEVVPKYYFEEDHPNWKETDSFEALSWNEFQELLTRLDLIKPRGRLLRPASPISAVTNMTAWHTAVYNNGIFTWGEVVDLGQGEDVPAKVKWFRVEFGKKNKAKPAVRPSLSLEKARDENMINRFRSSLHDT
jgi:hypothetical protein